MDEVTTIGLDLTRSMFQAHGTDAAGEVVFRKNLRRDQVLSFFAGHSGGLWPSGRRDVCEMARRAASVLRLRRTERRRELADIPG